MASKKQDFVDVRAVAVALGLYPSSCPECRGWPYELLCGCGKWAECEAKAKEKRRAQKDCAQSKLEAR